MPTRLFEDRYVRESFRNADYSIDTDGRFLLTRSLGSEAAQDVGVFVGFNEWVRKRVAGER